MANHSRIVELYEFIREASIVRYTSAKRDFVLSPNTWFSEHIDRSGSGNDFQITVYRSNAIAQLFKIYPPSEIVRVKITRYDIDKATSILLHCGRVSGCSWQSVKAVLNCHSDDASLDRPGLTSRCQPTCSYKLYGEQCGVNKSTYQLNATVTAIDHLTVTANYTGSFADGYFAGGDLAFNHSTGLITRTIVSHYGNNLKLRNIISELSVGSSVIIAPGCDHSLGVNGCARFSNQINSIAMPYIPTVNLFVKNIFN